MSNKNKIQELKDNFSFIKEFIEKGIEMDKKNQILEAYEYYIEGLKVIDNVLLINFTENE